MSGYIDPATSDYRLDTDQTSADQAEIMHVVHVRLNTRLGGWWADKALGSRLHELRREPDLPRVWSLARQYALDALKPVVDARRWQSVECIASHPKAGLVILTITVQQFDGKKYVVQNPVRVGG